MGCVKFLACMLSESRRTRIARMNADFWAFIFQSHLKRITSIHWKRGQDIENISASSMKSVIQIEKTAKLLGLNTLDQTFSKYFTHPVNCDVLLRHNDVMHPVRTRNVTRFSLFYFCSFLVLFYLTYKRKFKKHTCFHGINTL